MQKVVLIISVYYESKMVMEENKCGVKNLWITARGQLQNKNCVNNLSFMGNRGIPDIRVNYLWLCEYHWIANFEEKNGVNILGIAGMIS